MSDATDALAARSGLPAAGSALSGRPPVLAIVELVDRDGHVRQALDVRHWPVRIGRSLDNDLVLADPHVAPWHCELTQREHGLELVVGDTRNGVRLGARHLRAGERTPLGGGGGGGGHAGAAVPIELTLGRTLLRLRLAEHRVAPELVLAPTVSLRQRALPMLSAALLLAASLVFQSYLTSDPDSFTRAAGTELLSGLAAAALWCGLWALLSKTFTRQSHFSWHVRVLLYAGLALTLIGAVAPLVAFAFSWPAVSDFAFVPRIGVVATALYFHLLAVEPARGRALRWVTAGGAVASVALAMWFNVQRTDRLGDELYMNHLYPPGVRLAKPLAADAFVDGLATLKAPLDKAAKEPARSDDLLRTEPE